MNSNLIVNKIQISTNTTTCSTESSLYILPSNNSTQLANTNKCNSSASQILAPLASSTSSSVASSNNLAYNYYQQKLRKINKGKTTGSGSATGHAGSDVVIPIILSQKTFSDLSSSKSERSLSLDSEHVNNVSSTCSSYKNNNPTFYMTEEVYNDTNSQLSSLKNLNMNNSSTDIQHHRRHDHHHNRLSDYFFDNSNYYEKRNYDCNLSSSGNQNENLNVSTITHQQQDRNKTMMSEKIMINQAETKIENLTTFKNKIIDNINKNTSNKNDVQPGRSNIVSSNTNESSSSASSSYAPSDNSTKKNNIVIIKIDKTIDYNNNSRRDLIDRSRNKNTFANHKITSDYSSANSTICLPSAVSSHCEIGSKSIVNCRSLSTAAIDSVVTENRPTTGYGELIKDSLDSFSNRTRSASLSSSSSSASTASSARLYSSSKSLSLMRNMANNSNYYMDQAARIKSFMAPKIEIDAMSGTPTSSRFVRECKPGNMKIPMDNYLSASSSRINIDPTQLEAGSKLLDFVGNQSRVEINEYENPDESRRTVKIENESSNIDERVDATRSASDMFQLNKNGKKWRSMNALRDSIRNLTSCVSTKSTNKLIKKNLDRKQQVEETDNELEISVYDNDDDDEQDLTNDINDLDEIPHNKQPPRKYLTMDKIFGMKRATLSSNSRDVSESHRTTSIYVGDASLVASSVNFATGGGVDKRKANNSELATSGEKQQFYNKNNKRPSLTQSSSSLLSLIQKGNANQSNNSHIIFDNSPRLVASANTGNTSTLSLSRGVLDPTTANKRLDCDLNQKSSPSTPNNNKTTIKKIKIKKRKTKTNSAINQENSTTTTTSPKISSPLPVSEELIIDRVTLSNRSSSVSTLSSVSLKDNQKSNETRNHHHHHKTENVYVSNNKMSNVSVKQQRNDETTRSNKVNDELSQDYSSQQKLSLNGKEITSGKVADSTASNETSKMIPNSNAASTINTRISIKNSSVERLSKIFTSVGGQHIDMSNMSTDSTSLKLLPMISLPDNDNYWSEGWKPPTTITTTDESNHHGTDELVISSSSLSTPLSTSSSSSPSPSPSNQSANFNTSSLTAATKQRTTSFVDFESVNDPVFLDSFMDKQHVAFYGTSIDQEGQSSPFILSYRTETFDSYELIRVILRTKETNYFSTIPVNHKEETILPVRIVKSVNPDINVKSITPIVDLNCFKLIRNFDTHNVNKHFKFGVIYMKKGQITEEELFSNQEHSEHFDKFLTLLGERIKLKDFEGFRGGLDTSHGQTGEYSLYERFQNKEIMYHVSTFLPYNKNDHQQLERKRHIGNDIVALVFQEDNTPFAPDMIASNFLHTFIVVQKLADQQHQQSRIRYRVSVTARKDVPNFSPPLPNDCIFEHDQVFKEWLLNKLINAEYASYKADKFKKLKERTRSSLLDSLYTQLDQSNQAVLNSLDPASLILHTLSTRIPENDFINNNNSSSTLLLNGNSTHSVQNLSSNSSASFKFSLINTVRKAFKKEKEKDINSLNKSTSGLIKERSSTTSMPYNNYVTVNNSQTETYNTSQTDSVKQSQQTGGRMRSSTFATTTDTGSSPAYTPSLQSLKQKHRKSANQAKDPKLVVLKNNKMNESGNLISKIGSMDSLNHIENYNNHHKASLNQFSSPAKSRNSYLLNNANYPNSSLTDLHRVTNGHHMMADTATYNYSKFNSKSFHMNLVDSVLPEHAGITNSSPYNPVDEHNEPPKAQRVN